jgi:hypothetical protein
MARTTFDSALMTLSGGAAVSGLKGAEAPAENSGLLETVQNAHPTLSDDSSYDMCIDVKH